MLKETRRFVKSRPRATAFVSLGFSLGLYLIGFKLLLVPIAIVIGALFLPMPRMFQSWLSRLLVSLLINLSLIQIAAALQFLIFPRSDLRLLAACYGLVAMVLLWRYFALQTPRSLMSWNDAGAVIVILFFVLPFVPIAAGNNGIVKIAQMGSLQSVDALNHHAFITDMSDTEHLDLGSRIYYPKGFHMSVAFIQEAFIGKHNNLSWVASARLYLFQYLLFGSLMAYFLYSLALAWFERPVGKVKLAPGLRAALALALGAPLAVLYGLPFVNHGFLNMFFVVAMLVAGLLYLDEANQLRREETSLPKNEQVLTGIVFALLLFYGISASWTLLLPFVALIALLFFIPVRLNSWRWMRELVAVRNLPVIITSLLLLIPVYLHHTYSRNHPNLGSALTGDLRILHVFTLLAGLLLVLYLIYSKKLATEFRRTITNIFLPYYALTGTFIILQFFLFGEARYYAIKASLILELLLLALAVAVLFAIYVQNGLAGWQHLLLMVPVPLITFVLLLGAIDNPLKQTRDLFRQYTTQGKPAYLDDDVARLVELGAKQKIGHFNALALHYEESSDKFYAHAQATYWAVLMAYSGRADAEIQDEFAHVYDIFSYGIGSPEEQVRLIADIREVIALAREDGSEFFMVTDAASAPKAEAVFGAEINYVY